MATCAELKFSTKFIFNMFNREEKKKKETSSTKEVHKKIILLIHLFN